jgi:hypothetical protein
MTHLDCQFVLQPGSAIEDLLPQAPRRALRQGDVSEGVVSNFVPRSQPLAQLRPGKARLRGGGTIIASLVNKIGDNVKAAHDPLPLHRRQGNRRDGLVSIVEREGKQSRGEIVCLDSSHSVGETAQCVLFLEPSELSFESSRATGWYTVVTDDAPGTSC